MRSFETIVAGTEVDDALCQRCLAASSSVVADYLILFNARSGSSWLTELLTDRLGYPDEFINPEFLVINAAAAGTTDKNVFLRSLRGRAQRQYVFGIEATSEHIEIFGEDAFFNSFKSLTVFHLWRENLVAQAVSLYRAVKTGVFHSVEGKTAPDPIYDADELARWYTYLSHVENKNVRLIECRKLNPVHLTYETLFRDERETLDLFYRTLGRPNPNTYDPGPARMKKLGSSWSKDIEGQFRKENADTVERIEASRLVKRYGWSSSLGGRTSSLESAAMASATSA